MHSTRMSQRGAHYADKWLGNEWQLLAALKPRNWL